MGTYAAFVGALTSGNKMDARPVNVVPFFRVSIYLRTALRPPDVYSRSAERARHARKAGAEFS